MLSDEVRTRLSRLHDRGSSGVHSAAPTTLLDRPRAATHAAYPRHAQSDHYALGEECHNESGSYWRIARPLAAYWPQAASAVDQFVGAEPVEHGTGQRQHPELAALGRHFPQDTLFLDLETCGFAGSTVFLAGLVWHADGRLVVEQLLARNYAEERALLAALWQIAGRNQVLATFNGKTFDWPMVHDRSTRHHLGRRLRRVDGPSPAVAPLAGPLGRHDARPELVHCDLLHHARRRWKHLLPDCKLQTLERYVCRRARHDDLPGSLVPAVYHHYVRTGDVRRLEPILRHNAWDLVTLVQLACTLLASPGAAGESRRGARRRSA